MSWSHDINDAINLSGIATLNVKGSDYHCIISLVSKTEAINLYQNVDLAKKSEKSKNIKKLFSYIKMG